MKKREMKKFICVFSMLIILINTITFLISFAYSFLQADDFSHAMGVGVFNIGIGELFIASIKYSIQMYKTWQGTYFSMFIQALFSPLNGIGDRQLPIILVLNGLLFFVSLFILIREVCNFCFKIKNMWHFILPIYSIILFSIMNFKAWTEVFYWFSGSTSYSIPLSCMFIAIVFLLRAMNNHNKINYFMSSLFAFLMAGGSLEIAGTGCSLILFIVFWGQIRLKKLKGGSFVFCVALIGAFINVLAPGNYVRHGYIDSTGLHFMETIKGCFIRYIEETDWLINNTAFVCCIIICVLLGAANYNKIQKFVCGGGYKEHSLRIVSLLIIPYVTIFPVELAYGGTWFPNRCQFVLDVILILIWCSISFYCGSLVERWGGMFEIYRKLVIFFTISICLVAFSSSSKLTELKSYEIFKQLVNYEIQSYSKQCKDIFKDIEDSDKKEITIENIPETIINFPIFLLNEDEKHWINASIADYYGKNYIKLKK